MRGEGTSLPELVDSTITKKSDEMEETTASHANKSTEGDDGSLDSNNTSMQFFDTNVDEISPNLDKTLAKVEDDVVNNSSNNTPASGEDHGNKGSKNNEGGTSNNVGTKNSNNGGTVNNKFNEGSINGGGTMKER